MAEPHRTLKKKGSAATREEGRSKEEEDKVLKWLTTQAKFIQLERDAEASQVDNLLKSLPRKVLFFYLNLFVISFVFLLFVAKKSRKRAHPANNHYEYPPLQELEKRGMAITRLQIEETRTGLYGRTIVTLCRPNINGSRPDFPTNNFGPGDIVQVLSDASDPSTKSSGKKKEHEEEEEKTVGLVYRTTANRLQLAFNQPPDLLSLLGEQDTVTVVLVANDVTFRRMDKSTDRLRAMRSSGNVPRCLQVLFGQVPNSVDNQMLAMEQVTPYNEGLNEPQIDAIKFRAKAATLWCLACSNILFFAPSNIRFALASREVAVIHGPPGTGKTTTVVELVHQLVQRGLSVLACAPSNIAVDNMVERIARGGPKGLRMVRIGHPARVLSTAAAFTLDDVYRDSNAYEVVRAMVADMDRLQKDIQRTRNWSERRSKRNEWNAMKKELKQRETQGVRAILRDANVVLATCTGAADKNLSFARDMFDVAIVDEAGQGLDALVMIPLLRAKKLVLAGDHLQLPPTIKSVEATTQEIGTLTFFERLIMREKNRPEDSGPLSRLLSVQYRMNELIMQFSSKQLYDDKLTSHTSVKDHKLVDVLVGGDDEKDSSAISKPTTSSLTDDLLLHPLILVDTAGLDLNELGGEQESKKNEGEADVVCTLIHKLLGSDGVGLLPSHVGIISPYNAQVELLRDRLKPTYPALEINSVDSFQGREKEVIIMSLVRSNSRGDVGFLKSDQRTNVAITRAKRCLILVTDTETTSHHGFLQKLFAYFSDVGEVWSAAEFLPEVTHYTPPTVATSAPAPAKTKTKTAQKVPQKQQQAKPSVAAVTSSSKPSKAIQTSTSAPTAPATLVSDALSSSTSETDESFVPAQSFQVLSEQPSSSDSTNTKIDMVDAKSSPVLPSAVPTDTPNQSTTPIGPISSDSAVTATANTSNDSPNNKTTSSSAVSGISVVPLESKTTASAAAGAGAGGYASQLAEYRKQQQQQQKSAAIAAPAPVKKTVKQGGAAKKVQAPPKQPKKPNEKDEFLDLDDDDAILEAASKVSTVCHMTGCRESVKMIFMDCSYCRHRYCLRHVTAETHGCGDRARQLGRQEALKQAKDIKARGPDAASQPKLKDWQRNALQSKLTKKLDEKKGDRTRKEPEKKKK
jgi:ATP-dependent RNA/DNA helicase IGHMBP2